MDNKTYKVVKVNFEDKNTSIKLLIKGNNAIEQTLEIIKTFDKICRQIKNEIT